MSPSSTSTSAGRVTFFRGAGAHVQSMALTAPFPSIF